MAQNRSLPEVLRAVVGGIAQCKNVVLTRIWLIAPGDICATCRFQSECPDQTRCLHLVASAGNPGDGKSDYTQLDGGFRRFPLGVRKIGRVGNSGEPLLIPGVRGDEEWIAEPKWMKHEKVKTFAAQPLAFRGEVLGVLALFDTGVLGKEDFQWLRVFADHAAVSIANARAFEEIAALRWDFDWQQFFNYGDGPVDIQFGDKVRITCGYDTTGRTDTVTWGEGTLDEMCLTFLYTTQGID